MRIAVCVKIVDGEINPFDECALEEALRITDAEVFAVSMCPQSAAEKLRSLTRLGVKEVYLLSDKLYAGSDTLATAYILSEFLKKQKFDCVFCGRQTIDGDTAQVGPCLATLLGIGLITNVMKICSIDETAVCETRLGHMSVPLPALLTIERINTLRFPSIRSKLGEITVLNNSQVGADRNKCGLSGSATRVLKTFENSAGKRKCKFIKPCEFLNILSELKQSGKKNIKITESDKKLPYVIAIGDDAAKKACEVADKVETIYENDPFVIAGIIKKKAPPAVLWNADLVGRRNAPVAAALINAGLCADCTALETDGETLYMYRPARGGNIIAKIMCITPVQMATVRCAEPSDDIIVSGGRGVAEDFDKIHALAKKIGAEVGASRAVIDKNVISYEAQIGLTGKSVSPKIYIAIGISGAVQHTCAIENSDFIIAINPDASAPIFEYADYGIVITFDEFLSKMQ
ncbi:MAG: FAD-binding protein [Clostridia bacterium]|nr:FAD-binding protein [Clostridia bacterium]